MATTDPLIGRVLEGRYRIRARLASGGMSTVYVALDERLDREVAVKVMAPSLSSDPVFLDRFSREARAAAKLSHVNAVAVFDQGHDGGSVFLVMELVRGRTLRDLLRERGYVSPAEAVSLMEPVLVALAAAHRAGLVHRDIKPENILLSDDGVVKVADFGLARAVESNPSSTHTGLMMGTVAYSSPEQFRRGNADTRSDVYSAGIVLFELLVGHPPYSGPDAMAVAYQHVHHDVPPPSSIRRGIASPLDSVVQRATNREPSARPLDAGAFLAELHDVRRDLRLPVLPVPRRPRADRDRMGTPRGQVPIPPAPDPRAAAQNTLAATGRTAPDPRQGHPQGAHPTLISSGLPPTHPSGYMPEPAPPPRVKKKHRFLRTMIGALVLLLLCAAIIAGSWWFASGRYASVPDVRNEPAAQATSLLLARGFTIGATNTVASDTVPKGSVISTDPDTGARILHGKSVVLTVSSGPTFYAVPDVRRQTQGAATAALAGLVSHGVTVRYAQAADDTTPSGQVVRTDPAVSEQVKRGDTVIVYVSTGPPILSVPNVTGKTQAQAQAILTKAGFKVSATQDFSDTVTEGSVIKQTPPGTDEARKFTTVAIVVSKGPELIAVPSLPNLDPVDAATSTLEGLGFQVSVQKQFGGSNGLVVGMDPPAGTMRTRGSTITLYVI